MDSTVERAGLIQESARNYGVSTRHSAQVATNLTSRRPTLQGLLWHYQFAAEPAVGSEELGATNPTPLTGVHYAHLWAEHVRAQHTCLRYCSLHMSLRSTAAPATPQVKTLDMETPWTEARYRARTVSRVLVRLLCTNQRESVAFVERTLPAAVAAFLHIPAAEFSFSRDAAQLTVEAVLWDPNRSAKPRTKQQKEEANRKIKVSPLCASGKRGAVSSANAPSPARRTVPVV